MSKLNLDQILILSEIFSDMNIEKLPIEISMEDKQKMQDELKQAYLIKSKKEQDAEIKAIQGKYMSNLFPAMLKFIIANLFKARNSIKEFVGNYKGLDSDEAGKLGIKDITQVIFEIKDEVMTEFSSFLSQPGE
jgi:hypothetical protein